MTTEEVTAVFARQRELDSRVIDLARALAAATRIEVELVRQMRLELFPDSDAGLEANLWFGPFVADRDMLGLALVPECRDELRRQLALPEHHQTLERAWNVIAACHRPDNQPGVPPVVSLQEAVTYHALAGPASKTPQAHRHSMQVELGTLFKALDEDTEGSLASWLVRALPALPEAARQTDAAIALADKLRARDSSIVLENVPRADQQGAHPSLRAGPTIDVGCQRRTDGIEFSVSPSAGSYVMNLPRTSPLVVEIQTPRFDGWQTRSIEFDPVPEYVVPDPSPGSRCHITSATGQRLSLQPTFGSMAPALFVADNSAEPSKIEAIRRAVADIGWAVYTAGDAAPSGYVARAVLLSDSETMEPVEMVRRARASEGPTLLERPLLAWTTAGPELVRDAWQGATPIATTKALVLAVRSSGPVMASSGPSGIELWGPEGPGVPSSLLSQAVFSFGLSPDNRRVAFVSDDELLRVWIPGEPEARTLQGHRGRLTSVEFGRGGRRLVTTSVDRTAAIWLIDEDPRVQRRLRHDASVNHAAFNPDEKMIATACEDGTVCLWDVESGHRVSALRHDTAARSVMWSVPGDRLVVAIGREALVLRLPTLERVSSLVHDRPLQTAVMSRDGRRVATLDVEGIARLWHVSSRALVLPVLDPAAGKNRRVPPLSEIYPATPHGLAFASDDQSLLVASSGRALLWNTLTSAAPALDIETQLLNSVGTLRPLPAMNAEEVAVLRRQLLAIDERTLLAWEARSATEGTAAPVQAPPADLAKAPPTVERPRRVAVAIIDDGIDVLHDAFLDEDGRSRIAAIWDQNDTSGPSPEGFTYGRLHSAEDIAGYVQQQSVPGTLGRNNQGHGTHVASVAAGRRTGRFGGGQAPEAAIVAVVMRQDSASVVDGLSFVDGVAARLQLPMAISLSVDFQSGGRDGRSAFEVAVDEITQGGRKPGRAIVVPAGNRRELRQHATLNLPAGGTETLSWSGEGDSVQLELWAAAETSYRFHFEGQTIDQSHPEAQGALEPGGSFFITLTRRHVDNGDSQLFVRLGKLAGRGRVTWRLGIEAIRFIHPAEPDSVGAPVPKPIQAWLDSGAGTFEFTDHVSDQMTLAVPATAATVITVGAAVTERLGEPASFSSRGPTRDDRQKPDVSAPGTDIEAAKSGTASEVIKVSGTSMAAAQVAGIVATLFEEAATNAANWPTANQISAALRQTARGGDGRWDPALGYGVVDARAFTQAFSRSS